ncbi:hypothetical protein AMAG_15394 [Allomyces macrogynus ATCC 38327]|uniref:Uncharacterized protein n=1 Tax=Allomyces macrogynus (strain ATCC 38327) TaxID=578462 RepID=A0A0L0T755_ALLM3|nr:hypothetical protein AMAG_15394 [Allomyces macrogynus ATCC 38327]|eukprot:KNE70638.1 hypothetical protein AMAG_15394 [Allomyces macrogynus ATCC 38327]
MQDDATPRIARSDTGASTASSSSSSTATHPPSADDHAAPTDPAAFSREQLESCLFRDKYFLPGHCFLCAKCLAPDRSTQSPARRPRRSASGTDIIIRSDDDNDDDGGDFEADAGKRSDRARTMCPDGWQCERARQRCSWHAGMGASVKLAKLAAPPEDNVYYQCLPHSPYLDLARRCAKVLKMQEMTWVFCRGPGGCYSIWLRIYKHMKPASARTTPAASPGPVSPAPTPAPARSSRQSAPAAVPSRSSLSSKRERSASPLPPPPPPRPARSGTRADSAIVSSPTHDRTHRDRPPPPNATATVPAAALVRHHLTLVNAQVALQTQRTYLELRTRMHALGYSREEIDREVALARGLGVPGMMGMGMESAGWKSP